MPLQAINPANGETVATYDETAPAEVNKIVSSAHAAFVGWRKLAFRERGVPMRKAAEILRSEARGFAQLMAREMGKPLRDGIAEAQKCASCCDFYAERAEGLLARESVESEARRSFVTFNPLGVVLAVMPWNFPFWQEIGRAHV